MTLTNHLPEVEKMFVDALERFKLGLDVGHVLWFGWGPPPPTPGQPPSMLLAYWLVVSTPNPLLGQTPLHRLTCVPNLIPSQKTIDEAVMNTLGELRSEKAKVLSTQNGREHKRG